MTYTQQIEFVEFTRIGVRYSCSVYIDVPRISRATSATIVLNEPGTGLSVTALINGDTYIGARDHDIITCTCNATIPPGTEGVSATLTYEYIDCISCASTPTAIKNIEVTITDNFGHSNTEYLTNRGLTPNNRTSENFLDGIINSPLERPTIT